EVGGDSEMARSGLRFHLPVPRGSTIESAFLHLHHVEGEATPSETMVVAVLDSATASPFDDAHDHTPEEHDSGGLFAETVGDFPVGNHGDMLVSPDLASLVTHIVERSDYEQDGTIVFVISAGENMTDWAQFGDRHANDPAVLELTYRPPG